MNKPTLSKYSLEFKEQAVAKFLEVGISKTSHALEVSYVTLKNWVEKSESKSTEKSKPSYEDLEKEIKRKKKK